MTKESSMTIGHEIDAMVYELIVKQNDDAIGSHYLCLDHGETHKLLRLIDRCKSALEQSERKPTGWLYWVKGVVNSNAILSENYRHGPKRPDKRESWIPLYAALASDGKGK